MKTPSPQSERSCKKWLIFPRHSWGAWRVEDIETWPKSPEALWITIIGNGEPKPIIKRVQERRCQTCGLRERKPL